MKKKVKSKKKSKIKVKKSKKVAKSKSTKVFIKNYVKKLKKRLACNCPVLKSCLIIGVWLGIVSFIMLFFILFSNSLFIIKHKAPLFTGPLSFSNKQVVLECESYHPLNGFCTNWAKEDQENPDIIEEELIDEVLDIEEQKFFAVMVENHPEARPQSGLSSARVVYEVLVEGGITRYLLVFDNLQADDLVIGPVRSARPYYLWFAYELDNALYGHVGGSPKSLEYIQVKDINDCDEFVYGGIYYERNKERRAPHNVYTTVGDLEGCYESNNYESGLFVNIEPWQFLPVGEAKVFSSPDVEEINIEFSKTTYLANWRYNQDDKKYYRFYADGQPVVDNDNNKQVATSNVVVVEMPSQVIDDYGRLSMDTIGSGDLIIYRKGEEIQGTWEKNSKGERIKFLDNKGETIQLLAGQVWITAVPSLEIVKSK